MSTDDHSYKLSPDPVYGGGTHLGTFTPRSKRGSSTFQWTVFAPGEQPEAPPVRFVGGSAHSRPSSLDIPIGPGRLFTFAAAFCFARGAIPNKDVVQALVYDSFLAMGAHHSFSEATCQSEMARLGIATMLERTEEVGRLLFVSIHRAST